MKNEIATIIILFLSLNIYSQNYDDQFINPFWDIYGLNYLNTISSGKGFTGIATENDISGFNLNPASINLTSKNQINIQYTYKTSQPWGQSSFFENSNLKQQLFSGSVGYGKKINERLQMGFIYTNPTGMYFDLGERIRTDEFGNEIYRYDDYYNISSHSFNIPVIYKFNNFKIGLNFNYLLSRYTIPGESVFSIEHPNGFPGEVFSAASHYFKIHAGIVFSVKDKFSIGAKVVSGGKSEVKFSYPNGVAGDQVQKANYPWRAGAGFQFSFNKSFRLAVDYNYTNTSMMDGYKDRHDGHLGIEGDINKMWTLRAGFFTLLDYRKEETNIHWITPIGEYDQFFITFGAGYNYKNFAANIALLSSQFSTGLIKNTYINGGLTFNF